MNQQHKDDLIHEIGQLIIAALPDEERGWAKLAVVVEFEEGARGIYGYAYDAHDQAEAATIEGFEVVDAADHLRRVMREADTREWQACLIQLVRATQRIVVTFEYDDPERWHITAKTLQQVKAAICPPDDL